MAETTNRQLAGIFAEMAEVLEILGGDRFRVNAFARAARTIDALTEDLASIGTDLKALTALDGIGKGTAQRIAEFVEHGRIADHQQLLERIPAGLIELLGVSGLGPKTIGLLWQQGGVASLADLKTKLAGDDLAALPGLGKKKLDNLRKSIAFAESAGGRVRLGVAMSLARWLIGRLDQLQQVKQITYAGSLRRGRETIGDVDLLIAAAAADAADISDAFVKLAPVTDVLVKGPTKTSVRTSEGLQADLRIVEPGSYGAALMYFTGSKEHNVAMRERAIQRGLRLNEYGLFKGEQLVAGASEAEVFAALELAWVPPELREDRDELALAARGELPVLLTVDDIKSELHAHTTASDGRWSIREFALAAAERGFHTVAVTEHSRGQAQANGLDSDRLEQHIEAVRRVAAEVEGTIAVLAGTEVDILADGRLDYPDSLLGELDIVIAAVHGALSQSPAAATKRLLAAINHRSVTIIAHPTGRLIGRREGLSPDMSQVIAAAAERGIALELNANNWRLDLRDTHARAAIEAGVKLAINTDAHGPGDFDELPYGVMTARRAGATKGDVINCLSRTALAKWLAATRR